MEYSQGESASLRPQKNCDFCGGTDNLRLCYCKTKVICSKDCWSALCQQSQIYKLGCEKALATKKCEEYKSFAKEKDRELKSLNPSGIKVPKRDPVTGRYLSEEDPNQPKKKVKNDQNKAYNQKVLVIDHMKKYATFKPKSLLAIRELKPTGRGVYWYKSKGYNPLLSKSKIEENSREDRDGSDTEEEQLDRMDETDEEVTQERKDNTKTYCSLCHEAIGVQTGRLKCSFKNCQEKYSVHMRCLGFHPSSSEERKLLQKMYFCQQHGPSDERGEEADKSGESQQKNSTQTQQKNSTQTQQKNSTQTQQKSHQPSKQKGYKNKVRLSMEYFALLGNYAPKNSEDNNILQLAEYKLALKKYVEVNKLEDPDSKYYLILNPVLANMVDVGVGTKISYVNLRTKLLQNSHLSNVGAELDHQDGEELNSGGEIPARMISPTAVSGAPQSSSLSELSSGTDAQDTVQHDHAYERDRGEMELSIGGLQGGVDQINYGALTFNLDHRYAKEPLDVTKELEDALALPSCSGMNQHAVPFSQM